MLKLARGPSTESTLDLLAEAGEFFSRSPREGTGAKPPGGAVGRGQMVDRQAALPGCRERDGRSKFGFSPFVRHAEVDGAYRVTTPRRYPPASIAASCRSSPTRITLAPAAEAWASRRS